MEEHIWNFDVTPGDRARGVDLAQRVQKSFCTKSHVACQSKVMESRTQWCKNVDPWACQGSLEVKK